MESVVYMCFWLLKQFPSPYALYPWLIFRLWFGFIVSYKLRVSSFKPEKAPLTGLYLKALQTITTRAVDSKASHFQNLDALASKFIESSPHHVYNTYI